MLDLAQEQVIDRAKHPLFGGRLEGATHRADGLNQSCGDEVHIELEIKEGTVLAARHEGRSCTICAASADLLAEWLVGKDMADIAALIPEEVTEMLGIQPSPIRLKCALLPLEAVREALK